MPELSRSIEKAIGHAGVERLWGEFFDSTEPTKELRWPESVQVFEKMRRTESKIQATWWALTLPIRRTSFRVRPNGARDEIVERLSRNVNLPIEGEEDDLVEGRRKGRFSWPDHLRHALLHLLFGHMGFEQLYDIGDDGLASLRKLEPRMPQTISKVKVARDGGLEGIEQWPPSDQNVLRSWNSENHFIPVDRLLWYVNDREAGNWIGRSILRSVYRNWMLRNRFYRLDAMAKERNSMGVPTLERTVPGIPTSDEQEAADNLVRNFRAGEFAGDVIPHGYKLRLLGVEGTLPDALESAKHHGEEISTGMLQSFLDLGRTEHGNRALGETFVDFFLMAENAVLGDLLETFNLHQVEDWVDLNWGEDEIAPLVIATEVGTETAPTADALARLIEVAAIKPDRSIRNYLRRTFRLPAEIEEEAEPTGTTYQYDLDYQIVTIDERRAQIGLPPLPNGQGAVPPVSPVERSEAALAAANRRRAQLGLQPVDAATLERWASHGHRPLRAAQDSPFRRELFSHELSAKTDFEAIQGQWEDALERLIERYKQARAGQVDELLEQIEALVDAGDIDALGALELGTDEAREVIEDELLQHAGLAANEAVAEAGRQGTKVSKPDLDADPLVKRATATAMLLARDLASVAGRKAIENAGGALTGADVAQRVREHIESLTDTYLSDQLGGALTGAQNAGRLGVMQETKPDRLYASELLDASTCINCSDIDGKEYGTVEDASEDYPSGGYYACLGGPRCRGTIVAIYGEAEPSVP